MTDNEEDYIDAELIDIADEIAGELTEDILSKIQWRMKNGELIYVKLMEDRHLRNCALFLINFGYTKCIAPERIRVMWLRILNMEWQRRMEQRKNGIRRWLVQ